MSKKDFRFSDPKHGDTPITKGTAKNVVTVTAAYQATDVDEVILANGTFAVTLPSAVGLDGRIYIVKNIGAGTVTVNTSNSQTIDGGATASLNAANESIVVMSDNANWKIVDYYDTSVAPAPSYFYGSFYDVGNLVATSFTEAAAPQGVICPTGAIGEADNFTFDAGTTGSITAYADNLAGGTTVTAAGHTLVDGDWITIVNTTNYNGSYQVFNVAVGSFDIALAFVADDAQGEYHRGDRLVAGAGSTSTYLLQWHATVNCVALAKVFQIYPEISGVRLPQAGANFDTAAALSVSSGAGMLIDITAGQHIYFKIANQTDLTDCIIDTFGVSLLKIK